MKYWEIIADNLCKAGWSWGCVSAIDSNGRKIWIVDAHRDGKRFMLRADEKLTAFLELERVTLNDDCRNQGRTVNGWKVFETLGVEHKVSHFPELRFVVSVERHEEHSRSFSICVTVRGGCHFVECLTVCRNILRFRYRIG
jgi:hypothetical protein